MSSSRFRRTRIPLLLLALPLTIGVPGDGSLAAEGPPSRPAASASTGEAPPPGRMTLDAWRALKKAADDLMSQPRGPERIAKCEAFLKEHPDYPEPQAILGTLFRDYLDTGSYDPAHVADLFERQMRKYMEESDEYALAGASTVERFYIGYGLPAESAQRLLDWNREALERERRELDLGPDPWAGTRERQEIRYDAFRLQLVEGRLHLARGDAAGALKELQEAEESLKQAGRFVLLRDSLGKEPAALPADISAEDQLNLSMASATSRLGNRAAAMERLGRVLGTDGPTREFASTLRRLREELGVQPPPTLQVRGDPAPAPDFSLEDLDGRTVRLSDYRGKVVLLMVWTTW